MGRKRRLPAIRWEPDVSTSQAQWGKLGEALWRALEGRRANRNLLVLLGMTGVLSFLLNGGQPGALLNPKADRALGALRRDLRALRAKGSPWSLLIEQGLEKWRIFDVPEGLGQLLAARYQSGGWGALIFTLVSWAFSGQRIPHAVAMLALAEALAFQAQGFRVAACDHGAHLYLTDRSSRRDCPVHAKAGAQARWRRSPQAMRKQKVIGN